MKSTATYFSALSLFAASLTAPLALADPSELTPNDVITCTVRSGDAGSARKFNEDAKITITQYLGDWMEVSKGLDLVSPTFDLSAPDSVLRSKMIPGRMHFTGMQVSVGSLLKRTKTRFTFADTVNGTTTLAEFSYAKPITNINDGKPFRATLKLASSASPQESTPMLNFAEISLDCRVNVRQ